jgi:hypothetical protein
MTGASFNEGGAFIVGGIAPPLMWGNVCVNLACDALLYAKNAQATNSSRSDFAPLAQGENPSV